MVRVIKLKEKNINEKAQTAINDLQRDWKSESRWAMIQALIPLGLQAVEAELQKEVTDLVGERYSRGGVNKRWGSNNGSVFLGDQKVSTLVPRVRNIETDDEVPLKSYERLQNQSQIDDIALSRIIHGISQRNYEKAAVQVPETFGIKKSSVGRKFIRASARKLKEFTERDLSIYDIVAIFMDGKYFGERQIVIAMGVTIFGDKILLGFVETETENHKICKSFLVELKSRGLNLDKEILFVIDGGKGLRKGIHEVMGDRAIVQRCQWHKRENVISYLGKEEQKIYRKKLQKAYQQKTYAEAKSSLQKISKELQKVNQSAVSSLQEGLEETLTLHKLGVFSKLGVSFKTTNCIEGVNRELGRLTDRVDRWQNSNQRQRWIGTSLLNIEPRLRKIKGHYHLAGLRKSMKKMIENKMNDKQNTIDFECAS